MEYVVGPAGNLEYDVSRWVFDVLVRRPVLRRRLAADVARRAGTSMRRPVLMTNGASVHGRASAWRGAMVEPRSPKGTCEGCGAPLSIYNDETRCSVCQRSFLDLYRSLPPVPAQVWADREVREALSTWDLGSVARLVRERAGLRQERIAQLTGLSQGFLSQLESGRGNLVDIRKIMRFLDGLGTPSELLPRPSQHPLRDRPVDLGSVDPADGVDVQQAVDAGVSPARGWPPTFDDVLDDDRGSLDMALSAVAERSLSRVDQRQVDAHEEMEEALAGLYRSADPVAVLPATRAYADSVLDLLDRPMSEGARARLGAVAAGVHAQIGLWACHMHRPHLARRYLSTASDLASSVGDRWLQARTLGAFSYLYSSAPRGGTGGQPARALALLDQALDLAKDGDAFTKGWLATWRADQYAALGELDAARADVDLADAWLGGDDLGGPRGFFARTSYGYGMASHLDSVRGLVFALGGNDGEADQVFERVLATAANARRRVATTEHRALGHVEAGEPERACAALGVAVALATSENYGMGLIRAFGVRRRFDADWSSAACVRELDEQLHETLAEP